MERETRPAAEKPGKVIEGDDFLLYVPFIARDHRKHPLVIALAPDANAYGMLRLWQGVADRHGWLILASRFFRNGIDVNGILTSLLQDARALALAYPIDTSRIVASGFSGGGTGSYELVERAPELIFALVINSGLMHRSFRLVPDEYPKGKKVAYLASPTDFRYHEMNTDRVWVERLGWKTKWIEFKGGHRPAPPSAYEEAARWLESRW